MNKEMLDLEPFPDFSKYDKTSQKKMYLQYRDILNKKLHRCKNRIAENDQMINEYVEFQIAEQLITYQNILYQRKMKLEIQLDKANDKIKNIREIKMEEIPRIKIEKMPEIKMEDLD